MKKIAALFILSLFLFQCDNENEPAPENPVSWNKLALDGRIINQIIVHDQNLYAATDAGLYQSSKSDIANWELIGFSQLNVNSVISLSDGHIFAAVMDGGENLFSTNNGGDTWEPVDNNFGGESTEEINYLEKDLDDDQVIYGAGTTVVAKSEDEGETWTPLYGDWQGFGSGVDIVKVNPINDNIWAGGQGGIENGFLLKSENNGENWEEWQDLVENPTVVKEIIFHPDQEGTVYIGYEGALQKTTDSGDSFNSIIESEENRFYFGIDLSQENPETVFTGGWLKRFDEPQPLIIYYSLDGGITWTEIQNEDEDFGGIMEIIILEENEDQKKLLLGLYKGGVYEVTIDNSEFTLVR